MCALLYYTMKKIKAKTPVMLSKEDLLKIIDINTEIVVIAPWNGTVSIPVTIRMLDSVSLTSCGEFNTVSSVVKDDEEKINIDNILRAKNIHENMLKLALVSPTFKELEDHLIDKDFFKQAKDEIVEVEKLIEQVISAVDKKKHVDSLERLKVSIAFPMPEDFTSYIIAVLLQREATDINKLTRDTLLQAGFLGEKYNKRPSEFIEGTFIDKNKVDIDITALNLVHDYREQQKVNKGTMKWIGRGGK